MVGGAEVGHARGGAGGSELYLDLEAKLIYK